MLVPQTVVDLGGVFQAATSCLEKVRTSGEGGRCRVCDGVIVHRMWSGRQCSSCFISSGAPFSAEP